MDTGNVLYAAADIGGTSIKLGLSDVSGRLLDKWEIRTDTSDGGRNILPDICRSLSGRTAGSLLGGVGMGIPGPVSEDGVAASCVNLGWKEPTDLPAAVRELLPGVPVLCFGNDATSAAAGELWMGAGKQYDSAYLITLGTGVGGGYAERGNVICGAHGAAGEIGHIPLNIEESVPCSCGRTGCLEQYASANGMVRLALNLLEIRSGRRTENSLHIERLLRISIPEGPTGLDDMNVFSAKDICDFAREGDPFCLYVTEILGECLGLAMSYISCTIDPEVFLIGGGLSRAGSILLDAIRKGYAKYAIPVCRHTAVTGAALGNDAGIYGCIRMVLDTVQ